jgi:hypothetical protein
MQQLISNMNPTRPQILSLQSPCICNRHCCRCNCSDCPATLCNRTANVSSTIHLKNLVAITRRRCGRQWGNTMTPKTITTKQQLFAWEIMDKEGDVCGVDCFSGSGHDKVGSSACGEQIRCEQRWRHPCWEVTHLGVYHTIPQCLMDLYWALRC